ncbi:ABC transporter substrate-binding protein [Polynucleobacter sp. IMCC30063]|uniref:ABC transporter substrate-binding protein n=1 Tax=unclassified Polynucleobacter TaxID=2640945 RepID=UPI001F3FA1F1|nr:MULTISPECIES: ABC transporter substrate-binding protein [unclassified Polynucleobacter]MCE7505582.1 ABC transporter substrate-binding protein [Polynucleobacter sp. IMCC30063]MCE7526784.1 ABC transporter substrate-binding protein [Polynucleobacter sp. IMCC 30228]
MKFASIKKYSLKYLLAGLVSAGCISPGLAQTIDYGKVGSPVNLVVGYQPYYTEAWSGVIMRGKKFYEKYLPKGSTVEFQVGLQGAIIVNNMLAGKQQIGYVGDMPAIVSTTKPEVADIRLVGVLGMGKDMCNIVLVRPDAPDFKTPKDAFQWLNGKIMASPKGSCTDRFVQDAFKKENVKPENYLNQNIEVITSNFRAKKIDGAAIWEPTASKLVEEGLAKRVASGFTVGLSDGGFLTMRDDLIKARPDVAQAWLNAELDAQLFLADEKNAKEVIDIAMAQLTGFTRSSISKSVYGQSPDQLGSKVRFNLPFTFTPDVRSLLTGATTFLKDMKAINVSELRSDAIVSKFADEALKARNLKAPIGDVAVINPAPI